VGGPFQRLLFLYMPPSSKDQLPTVLQSRTSASKPIVHDKPPPQSICNMPPYMPLTKTFEVDDEVPKRQFGHSDLRRDASHINLEPIHDAPKGSRRLVELADTEYGSLGKTSRYQKIIIFLFFHLRPMLLTTSLVSTMLVLCLDARPIALSPVDHDKPQSEQDEMHHSSYTSTLSSTIMMVIRAPCMCQEDHV
jgi:hypothetical protein